MRLALFQPDIPQNTGTILRMAACLDFSVELIEPCGFPFDDRDLKRAGMDYLTRARLNRHGSWQQFEDWRHGPDRPDRLVLLTTRATLAYTEFRFAPTDIVLFGRESAGVPDYVHDAATAALVVPLADGFRSLNVAVTAAMVMGEALRQTRSQLRSSGGG